MLKARVITGIIAGLLVLGMVLLGPWPWRILVWVGTILSTWEYCSLMGVTRFHPLRFWACGLVTAIVWWFPMHGSILIPIAVAGAMLWPVVTKNQVNIATSSSVSIGLFYLGFGGASLAGIRAFNHGFSLVFFLLISIWMTDTVAFFAGQGFGGAKLWPSISPAKTVSGALSGMVGAAVGAAIWGVLTLSVHHVLLYVLCGAVISIAGQLGDLVESAYKRSANAKDSGHILPGHGGMLDRVDSLFFAAPVMYLLLTSGLFVWIR